jgi:cytochrome c oxidase subunit 3
VKKGDTARWLVFEVPELFWFSTGAIVLSSVALHRAQRFFSRNNFGAFRIWLAATAVLGGAFATLQVAGWQDLYNQGIFLQTNPSSSFLYVITGMHLVHLVAGMIVLLVTLMNSLRRNYDAVEMMKDELKPLSRRQRLKLTVVYWHFVDVLWIYLFVFFLLNQ